LYSRLQDGAHAKMPKPNQSLFVEALPYLGTGKLDLRTLKTLAGTRAIHLNLELSSELGAFAGCSDG